jgi:hypothetical protein
MVMRLPVRFISSIAGIAALAVCAGTCGNAQSTTAAPPASNGKYVVVDPLAGVRYDNRYDISLGAAYGHMKAGPPPLQQGANLGGLDLSGSYWLTKHWAGEATGRVYMGTSGAAVNHANANFGPIQGPFVSQYMFVAGPEWLGPHNKHGAFIAHAMIGGTYGDFEKDLLGNPPSVVGFFNNQVALAAIIGGHIDLNRSAHWAFRVTPDALYTRYGINYGNMATYGYWNFGLSVGAEYKFKKKR